MKNNNKRYYGVILYLLNISLYTFKLNPPEAALHAFRYQFNFIKIAKNRTIIIAL